MSDRIREVGAAVIEYVPDQSHRHEGFHRIAVAGHEVVVRPDGVTKGRKRSDAARRAADAAHERGASDHDTVEQIVGALVLTGATNIEVDGQAILAASGDRIVASLTLDVVQRDSSIEVVVGSLGGDR